ncbi:MAG: exodeoxyribonuclease VII large subunit [Paraglaciecola sp.]|uniref:exodeoxyribonuclease VII large subunit n=1 Tax=Paraglaciecola sp. TaxID=1920173 RepID=UPI00274022B3|nr:exodeoxyribonuclease VII large subunit [Paraglaciecola sp.]MDP5032477.1 exodeoxyribonuclease VII large subunit [Paraglaciecola sp.]MDP5041592.1 exodeoxyribonuclease VII large subunit [Paraglaciecola sp.]MDP5133479.1 exodeoxyribonuclease VII large subunit [Paraglaciecola sp.]
MPHPQSATRAVLTVSKLNRLAKNVLETEIGQIWLSAEISNFVAASSGHWYFTLKDERAQIKAAMFKGANQRVSQRPKEGDKILVRANISLYEPRGDYQLIVDFMEPEGEGQLKQQFDQLKIKLAAEGLFAHQHKQALPEAISKVGVITSATGAALHDILTVLKRRNPAIEVVIYPTQVQGEAAVTQICHAIQIANRRKEVQVLIVGRGGGSLEDLWCFNHESVARAIFNSTVPIVSAVGHEVDVSIADFVADLRAPTPSAAAELVSRDQSALVLAINTLQQQLSKRFRARLNELGYEQTLMLQRLQRNHPQKQLEQKFQAVDQLSQRLEKNMVARVATEKVKQQNLSQRLSLNNPQKGVAQRLKSVNEFEQRLLNQWRKLLENKHQRLANAGQLLDTVSPLATLARGYSINFKQQKIVKSVRQLNQGDKLTTRFVDGEVNSEILSIKPNK